MDIKQAKALKAGDEIIHKNGGEVQTVRSNEPLRHCIIVRGESEDVMSAGAYQYIADNYELVIKAEIETQWIPFDKERMSEAVEYRKVKDKYATLEKVTLLNGVLAFENDGQFDYEHCPVSYIEMLVPVAVKYPCMMWCSDNAEAKGVMCFVVSFSGNLYYCNISHWLYATPLTAAELAEIGLKQID